MVVELVWADAAKTIVPVTPRWFVPKKIASNLRNSCTEVGALAVHEGRLLILIPWNDRPGWDHIALVLVDTRARRVLGVLNDVGETPDQVKVIAHPRGIEVLVHDAWLLDPTNGGEFAVPRWKVVGIAKDKITARWRE